MADFMTNLWEAVFTPGPTPTLLLATNVTFASLQLLLAALFAVTFSIHFFILSVLCAGLWWAINWFAYELLQAQAKEDEAERIRSTCSKHSSSEPDDDTELELPAAVKTNVSNTHLAFERIDKDEQSLQEFKSNTPSSTTSGTTSMQPSEGESRQRKALSDLSASSADFGTDSEWIKIDGE
jgi:hypothetical protein